MRNVSVSNHFGSIVLSRR